MSAALRTLPALDLLLRQLAAAAGQALHSQLRQRGMLNGGSTAGSSASFAVGGSGKQEVVVPCLAAGHSRIMPFTAAALGSARSVRACLPACLLTPGAVPIG